MYLFNEYRKKETRIVFLYGNSFSMALHVLEHFILRGTVLPGMVLMCILHLVSFVTFSICCGHSSFWDILFVREYTYRVAQKSLHTRY